MMKRFLALVLTAVLLSLPQVSSYAQKSTNSVKAAKAATTTRLNPIAVKSANEITAEQLKDYLSFIASDALEGRNTPSRGLDTAAQFMATLLSRWGLKPAGDNGTFFQKIALKRTKADSASSSLEIGGQKFNSGADFVPTSSTGKASGSLVFVGNGWMFKSKNIDAFQGVDVKGKIVVVVGSNTPSGLPQGIAFNDLNAEGRGTAWADPVTNAQMNGAIGIIQLASLRASSNWENYRAGQERERYAVEKFLQEQTQPQPQAQNFPVITISQQTAQKLFEGETKNPLTDATAGAFDLNQSKQVSMTSAFKADTVYTQNVVAIFEGSDPKLKNEYVAVGAHYDHVGINANAPAGTDSIFNGADDDGSGTVALLAMAEAFAKSPRKPKRSILFVWHAGEEKGLWGARYFVENPTVPLESIVTQLNLDMIGRSKKEGDTNQANKMLSGPNEVYVIGSNMMSSTIYSLSEGVNNSYIKLNFNYHYDQPNDPERLFFRSDHYHYARKGIPIIFYFDGVHEDYHRVGDHVEKIDFQKMEKITRTVFLTAWTIAELSTRPAIDKELPEQLRQGR